MLYEDGMNTYDLSRLLKMTYTRESHNIVKSLSMIYLTNMTLVSSGGELGPWILPALFESQQNWRIFSRLLAFTLSNLRVKNKSLLHLS